MNRENRYWVLKVCDVENYFTDSRRDVVIQILKDITAMRIQDGRDPLNCVVIEEDWPEYEPTWELLSKRMAGEFENDIGKNDIIIEIIPEKEKGGFDISNDIGARITHKKAGLVATCLTGRSIHQNRTEALKMLREMLAKQEQEKQKANSENYHLIPKIATLHLVESFTLEYDRATGSSNSWNVRALARAFGAVSETAKKILTP